MILTTFKFLVSVYVYTENYSISGKHFIHLPVQLGIKAFLMVTFFGGANFQQNAINKLKKHICKLKSFLQAQK